MTRHSDNSNHSAKPEKQGPAVSAEAWFARLRADDVSEGGIADFAEWLSANPANKAAFDEVTDLWHVLGEALPSADVVPLRATESEPASNQDTQQPSRSTASANRWFRPVSIAAVALLSAGVLWLGGGYLGQPQIQLASGVGEQVSKILADGSKVVANTDTKLSGALSEDGRAFNLDRGEALFHVVSDADRPFSVTAGNVTATALGTSFSVQSGGLAAGSVSANDSVEVVVLEGRVEVVAGDQSLVVSDNQQARFDGSRLTSSAVNAVDALAWQDGRLVYVDVSLEELVGDLKSISAEADGHQR